MMAMLSTASAAVRLKVSRRRVYDLIHAGRLPATREGWEWMIESGNLRAVSQRKPGRPRAVPRAC